MRFRFIPSVTLALLFAMPAVAEQPPQAERETSQRPITDDSVTAGDVVLTPLTDLNLTREQIDALLVQARAAPYDLTGIQRCSDIIAAVQQLDILLGEDYDTAEAKRRGVDAGRVAQWAVGTFIPFRGLIREVSGARAHERKVRDAILGGMMRRAFLKGVGQQKGCRYPGRPARLDEAADRRENEAARERAEQLRKRIEQRARKAKQDSQTDDGQQSISQPVAQPTP